MNIVVFTQVIGRHLQYQNREVLTLRREMVLVLMCVIKITWLYLSDECETAKIQKTLEVAERLP